MAFDDSEGGALRVFIWGALSPHVGYSVKGAYVFILNEFFFTKLIPYS